MVTQNHAIFFIWLFGSIGYIHADNFENPYCRIQTCEKSVGGMKSNTLCQFSNATIGSVCNPYKAISLTDTDISTILNVSNSYRRQVALGKEWRGDPGPQPMASNMRELKWDKELANMAQTHAQQCLFQHDTCRNVARFPVGQNLYVTMSTGSYIPPDWADAIKKWYDEVADVSSDKINNFQLNPKTMIGHYTQLVWADTHLIGCGISSYEDSTVFSPTYPYKVLFVCNYGPAGNWISLPIYKQGEPGSQCPNGTIGDLGLCVKK